MVVWGVSLWYTCVGVQEGLAAVRRGPWLCLGAEEALGIVWLLYSNTLHMLVFIDLSLVYIAT